MEVVLEGRDFAADAAEKGLLEQGFVVRRARPGDGESIAALCESEGYPGWGTGTAAAVQREHPTLFVAEERGVVRAFAAHSLGLPSHFGPMLTAAGLRGLGLGSVLLKRCLQDWQRLGLERCEIIWAGPLSFYARSVGATMGRAFWTFQKQLAQLP